MRTALGANWTRYHTTVVARDDHFDLESVRNAFYAGEVVMHAMMTEAIAEPDDNATIARFATIATELRDFIESVAARVQAERDRASG